MEQNITSAERYDFAVNIVLKHEGDFTNNSKDPGGPTKYGISLRFLKSYGIDVNDDGQINIIDVKSLTKSMAKQIYKQYWWDKYHYEAINSIYIATKIFDMAVNMGAHQAHILIQRACNHCGHNLVIDGILGGKTIAALNEISLHGREDDLKCDLQEEQKNFYRHITDKNPKLNVFLNGWLKRASW